MIHHACGQPAFLYDGELLVVDDRVRAHGAAHLDGSPMVQGERMVCDSCGAAIAPWEVIREQ